MGLTMATYLKGLSQICVLLVHANQNGDCHQKNNERAEPNGDNAAIDYSLNGLAQDDPTLIRAIQSRYLVPPNPKKRLKLQQKLTPSILKGQFGQPYEVDEIFRGKKRNGFFIEAGAYDGEIFSNSLFFEIKKNWTGLLVEPNPDAFHAMSKLNRNAYLLPHCFSTKPWPEVVDFDASALIGGIVQEGPTNIRRIKPGDIGRSPDYVNRPYHRRTLKIQCFPFYSVLLALGNPKVDYFSLDIEGAEIPVLRTIPWDKVDINVVEVEMNHLGEVFDGTAEELKDFMNQQGYTFHGMIEIDGIFVKNDAIKITVEKNASSQMSPSKVDLRANETTSVTLRNMDRRATTMMAARTAYRTWITYEHRVSAIKARLRVSHLGQRLEQWPCVQQDP
eukprot:maker-scaffold1057_size73593-snap-gene-0.26 protein:Tk01337 transcript:maker-scaffold1057_size73593-snap-gene-0.26-mRNA-1 annotation:"hypothetical protein DAPPUDRAFT_224483"